MMCLNTIRLFCGFDMNIMCKRVSILSPKKNELAWLAAPPCARVTNHYENTLFRICLERLNDPGTPSRSTNPIPNPQSSKFRQWR